jgi:hypothetical protein
MPAFPGFRAAIRAVAVRLGTMSRGVVIAAAVVAGALSVAPSAAADGPYAGDVPGITYGANLSAPCYQWDRFIFGRGRDGQTLACHFIENQSYVGLVRPPEGTGFWVISPKLYGVQTAGTPCPGPQAAAQSPEGFPMLCRGALGWQAGYQKAGDWGNGGYFFPAG